MFVVEFQNAFSDNVLRWLVTFLIIGMGFSLEKRDSLVPLVSVVFSLPFVLFSMAGGFFADRFSKRNVAITVKCAELGIMSVVTLGLWLVNLPLMLTGIFLMSTHSAIFGPTKYGMLPELLPEKKLSWGNGIFGLGTFSAAITGTILAGWLSDTFGKNQIWSGAILIALAVVGLSLCLSVCRLPAADPHKTFRANFLVDFWSQLKTIHRDRVLFLGVMGNTFLSFLAMLLQLTVVFYGKDIFHFDDRHSSFLQGGLLVGVGAGSLAAGFLSGGKIEYGLIPLGMAGLTVFSGVLSHAGFGVAAFSWSLGLLGFFGGFYNVPVNAIIQHRPEAANKGKIIAAAALLSWIGILLGSGVYGLLTAYLQLRPPEIFLFGAVLSLAGTFYCGWLMPASLLRFLLWCATHSIYRLRVLGRDHIPEKGGALFVCNHVSFVDAVLLLASTDRQVRFMMFKGTYELPYIKPFAKILGLIPISSEQRPREMIQSLQAASDSIRNGEVICIFAEGQITRIGHLLPFRRGFERIMKGVDAPIIPVGMDGVWGSIFSFEKGRFLWKLPRRFPYPVTINYGKPMPPTSTPFRVRSTVQELLVEAWQHRKQRMRPLPIALVNTARNHPFRFAMADAQNARIRFGAALVRSVFLARRLRNIWSGQRMVGLLLPPSVPGALVNHAALLLGKVPVNLNYSVSAETLTSCIRQCDIKTVITSKMFLDKIKLKPPCKTIFLEELMGRERQSPTGRETDSREQPGTPDTGSARSGNAGEPAEPALGAPGISEKLIAFFIAWFVPDRWLQQLLGAERKTQLEDLATVIFSSGSTGEPKGVMLSHYNIGSNVEQLEQVFGLHHRDGFLGILPFFHSFGFTGTLCLPAMLGVGAVYYPNPLDAKAIGPLVRDYRLTFLLATPTFLQLYLRGCPPEDFGSLRIVMTGAEKLPDRLAAAFEEHFGVRPLEGYGCTECAPAVAVNTQDFRSAGFRQIGAKRGKIGHPLPGVSVKIVDPENPWTGENLPIGQAGLMLVSGPNVMLGYLGKPEKTAEVLVDETGRAGGLLPAAATKIGERRARSAAPRPAAKWYCTGDIAAIDEDGFLQITDRQSRFSKIGGEMVPHIKVEEKLHELVAATEQTFVVAGVPDEKKGERLVVLHKLADEHLARCLEKLAQCDLPNLWKPRSDQFFRVDNFPLLGTGKLDLRKVKETAQKLSTTDGHG
ncbi:MAG TPA: MFS transporter [Candidatus Sulfopaludibacter sp.]|nr:MFS transporter [Candidatus Sulfopaludibacter sp.]